MQKQDPPYFYGKLKIKVRTMHTAFTFTVKMPIKIKTPQ